MENSTKDIIDYIGTLPKGVIAITQDKMWPRIVEEICAKYSLTDKQTIALRNIVFLVLVGLEDIRDFGLSIEREMNTSKILTEQIIGDLDVRVFKYAYNFVTQEIYTKNSGQMEATPEPVTKVPENPKTETQKPVESHPELLPVIENIPPTTIGTPRYGVQSAQITNPEKPMVPTEQKLQVIPPPKAPVLPVVPPPAPAPKKPEFVQKPFIPVPKFTAVSLDENGNIIPSKNPPPAPVSIPAPTVAPAQVDATPKPPVPTPEKPKAPIPPVPEKYTADPYREPIE